MNADPVEGVRAESPEDTEDSRPERVVVRPVANSRLEGLHAQYDKLKQAEKDAKDAFSELKSAITAELEALYEGDARPSEAYEIPSSLYGPAITVYYKSQFYLPEASIKEHFPEIYEAWKREKNYAEVRESQAGKSRGGRRK